MDANAAALISAGSGLLGALIGAGVGALSQRAQQRRDEMAELAQALAALAFALDMLELELRRLPRATVGARLTDRDRFPNLTFLLGWIGTETIGRQGMRAVRNFSEAGSRVMLTAPTDVLDPLQRLGELMASFDVDEPEWWPSWQEARGRFAQASRQALDR